MKQKIYGRGCQHTACFCQPTILYCIANMQNSWKSSSPREISFKKTFLLQYQHIKNIFFNENVYIVPCNTVLYMYIVYTVHLCTIWSLSSQHKETEVLIWFKFLGVLFLFKKKLFSTVHVYRTYILLFNSHISFSISTILSFT